MQRRISFAAKSSADRSQGYHVSILGWQTGAQRCTVFTFIITLRDIFSLIWSCKVAQHKKHVWVKWNIGGGSRCLCEVDWGPRGATQAACVRVSDMWTSVSRRSPTPGQFLTITSLWVLVEEENSRELLTIPITQLHTTAHDSIAMWATNDNTKTKDSCCCRPERADRAVQPCCSLWAWRR